MATINLTLTIEDDAKAQEMLDAFCEKYGYSPESGLTQRQFAKREVIEFFRLPWVAKKESEIDQAGKVTLSQIINSAPIT